MSFDQAINVVEDLLGIQNTHFVSMSSYTKTLCGKKDIDSMFYVSAPENYTEVTCMICLQKAVPLMISQKTCDDMIAYLKEGGDCHG